MRDKIKDIILILRPYTLIAPALGIVSGAITAYGANPRYTYIEPTFDLWMFKIVLAALAASLLNGASNTINQIFDIEIDKINKPDRVLPKGRVSISTAVKFSIMLYVISMITALNVNLSCLLFFLIGAATTIIYSVPPLRVKRFGWYANLTIAISRGVLLVLAGWSVTKPVASFEPWFIGLIFGVFVFGATTAKDFGDIEGDRQGGCRTLPILYGKEKAVKIMYPFNILPFIFIVVSAIMGVFTGNRWVLIMLGGILAIWGYMTLRILSRDLSRQISGTYPSWKHMYFMMFILQIGFLAAYAI